MIRDTLAGVALFVMLVAFLALTGCMRADAKGHPTVEIAPGYTAVICETELGLTGNKRSAGIGATVRWGCGK